MITFTKEQLIASAHARIEFAEMMLAGELEPLKERTWSIELELARIALASLEAEAVADVVAWSSPNEERTCDVRLRRHDINPGPLYTAPPAPANAEPVAWLWSHRKHPSEVTLVRPEDDERAEGAHWSGWSCQALYAAHPAPISVPAAMEMDDDFDSSFEHGKAVGWNACRAAMLQSFGNSEQLNSPVIPDGWQLVPIDPTKDMLRAGQSVVGFWLNTVHCYSKMLAAAPAAPQQEA
ncbi:hypothetical protein [Kluyvera georgiana]|uniref:hypothetical protein n=1 Tax=Kluyvera georgiana TaxID=73098 RepID=UPI003F673909